jgi:hypothetical protein
VRHGLVRRRETARLSTATVGASPFGPPAETPCRVGCLHRDSHEHGRPPPRLRVRPFPATQLDPAGTTASADFSTASGHLSASAVASHPTTTSAGHPATPVETSPDKNSNPPPHTRRIYVTAPR